MEPFVSLLGKTDLQKNNYKINKRKTQIRIWNIRISKYFGPSNACLFISGVWLTYVHPNDKLQKYVRNTEVAHRKVFKKIVQYYWGNSKN